MYTSVEHWREQMTEEQYTQLRPYLAPGLRPNHATPWDWWRAFQEFKQATKE